MAALFGVVIHLLEQAGLFLPDFRPGVWQTCAANSRPGVWQTCAANSPWCWQGGCCPFFIPLVATWQQLFWELLVLRIPENGSLVAVAAEELHLM